MFFCHPNWNSCFTYWILLFVRVISCYNLDIKFPILYERPPNEYFGYAVGLLENTNGYQALITAPRANSSVVRELQQPGGLFHCSISPAAEASLPCKEVTVDVSGNENKQNRTNPNFSYNGKKDDMWLGVSLDTQHGSQDNSVVVCGHLWKRQIGNQYFVNGICYVIDSQLNTSRVKKLLPFVDGDRQISRNKDGEFIAFFGYAQAGTSAVFSEDGQYLLLGSPGFNEGVGTIVSYKLDPKGEAHSLDNPIIPFEYQGHQPSSNGYSGYSVTSGKFFNDKSTYIAVGAPRDSHHYGTVHILQPVQGNSQLLVNETKHGVQLGEYFGASVCATDLNDDHLTDLLVGAPLHSEDTGGDEGKVYVYISNGQELQFFADLVGSNKPNARFGTSIGNIGDLNQDGYNDVAIGAPYEDGKGAVYIYHGTNKGLNKQHVQRIAAADFDFTISGFGISISRGLDIDDNSYLDLLIGAYSSSKAVLLRSRPVIQISSELKFDPSMIDRNVSMCDFGGGEKLTCFKVSYCLSYVGKHAPPSLEFETELKMDSGIQIPGTTSRGFLLFDDKPSSSVMQNITLYAGQNDSCLEVTAYIHNNIKDVITPIQFSLNYGLNDGAMTFCENSSFPENCPVIDPYSSANVTKPIHFLIDCGPDNKCSSDLVIKARIIENPENRFMTIGQKDVLTVRITISNHGEPAYAPVLSVYIPPEVLLVKRDLCNVESNDNERLINTTLQCDLGNSLKKGEMVLIEIKIDVKGVPLSTTSLILYFEVSSQSEEVNEIDNKLHLPLFFISGADAGIIGSSDDEQFFYTEEKSMVSVIHKYYVTNYGPSPVDKIDIYLHVPVAMNGKNGWINFATFTLEIDRGEKSVIPQKCIASSSNLDLISNDISIGKGYISDENKINEMISDDVTGPNVAKRSVGDGVTISTGKTGDYTLDCQTAQCERIHCVAHQFPDPQKFTKITVSAELNLTALNSSIEAWNQIVFSTVGSISMTGSQMMPETHPNEATVETIIMRPGPQPSAQIETWIIFVSIGAGILLLIIILIVLIKIGFFKRKQRDEMKNLMDQEDLKEIDPHASTDEETAEDKPLSESQEHIDDN